MIFSISPGDRPLLLDHMQANIRIIYFEAGILPLVPSSQMGKRRA